jgi:pimeloyl-ACP methyl ester carboxylesterase
MRSTIAGWGLVVVTVGGLGACGEDAVPALNQDTIDAVGADTTDAAADSVGGDATDATDTVDANADSTTETDGVADTSVVDTSVVDTSVADTTPVDTSVADTTPVDTSVPDTAPGDTVVAPPDPAATGPYAVDEEEDRVEGFDVVRYVPKTPGTFPAVVLVPGFLFDAGSFALYGRHLASHGIVTLIPTFGDTAFTPIAHRDLADHVRAMAVDLASDARVDASRVGVAGHSRGGKVAILAAIRDDRPTAARIKAVFGMDPVDAAGGPGASPTPENPSVTPELMAGLKVPFAVIGSEYGGTPLNAFSPACAPTDDNYVAYTTAASQVPAIYSWLAPKSGHNDFADPVPLLLQFACKAGDTPGDARALAKTKLVAFFKRYLAGDERYTL